MKIIKSKVLPVVETSDFAFNDDEDYSYEFLYKSVVSELNKLKKGRGIKHFCEEKGLPYELVIMFKNNKLGYAKDPYKALTQILEAFGYKVTKQSMYFQLKKKKRK